MRFTGEGLRLLPQLLSPATKPPMPFDPELHQRWWTDNWTDRSAELTAWLEESDTSSRRAVFSFVDHQPFHSILEIGPGLLIDYRLHWQHRPSIRYEVVDVTPEVLELAKSKKVRGHHAAIESLPLANNSFDFVYCRHVLEHCPRFEQPLAEMFRVATQAAAVVLFRHKATGTDEINYGTYTSLETVYHNTYARSSIAAYAKSLGWDTRWELTENDAVGFFTPL